MDMDVSWLDVLYLRMWANRRRVGGCADQQYIISVSDWAKLDVEPIFLDGFGGCLWLHDWHRERSVAQDEWRVF